MVLQFILFLLTFPLKTLVDSATTNNIAKQGCQTECGNITVPYPFGIGTDCSLNPRFNLTCNTSSEPPKLFRGHGNAQVYSISDSELRTFTKVSYNCYNESGRDEGIEWWSKVSNSSTFSSKNKFTVIGCDDYALINGTKRNELITNGCLGVCGEAHNVLDGQCLGVGCCQVSIPGGLSYYNVTLGTFRNHSRVLTFNKCGYGFLVEEGKFSFGGASDLKANHSDFVERIQSTMPRVLDWVIAPNETCADEVNVCKGNSSCYDVDFDGGGGYRCKCKDGYEGNPYLDQGCQDGI